MTKMLDCLAVCSFLTKKNIGENMSKNFRGVGLKEIPKRGRGTCLICGRTAVKLLYEVSSDQKTIKVCKQCRKRDIPQNL